MAHEVEHGQPCRRQRHIIARDQPAPTEQHQSRHVVGGLRLRGRDKEERQLGGAGEKCRQQAAAAAEARAPGQGWRARPAAPDRDTRPNKTIQLRARPSRALLR